VPICEQLSCLVIVPTYNESANVVSLVDLIFQHVPEVDILFVDDNSTDGTRSEIAKASAAYPNRVHLFSRPGKLGLGTAYVAGFAWGLTRGYDAFVEMDADHSHRPQDLAKLVQALQRHPVVIGSRYIKGGGTQNWSVVRKAISRLGSLYARTILRIPVVDVTGGFNGWRREVIQAIGTESITSEGYTFQVELKYRASLAGYQLFELPILFVERRAGQSKMTGGIIWEAIHRVWQLALQRAIIAQRLGTKFAKR